MRAMLDADSSSLTARSAWVFSTDFDGEEWMQDGLCAQTDPEAFFPEKGGSSKEGKRICAECPVRVDCLRYALANKERFGIWGGLTACERRGLECPRVVVAGRHGGYRPGAFGRSA